MADPVEPLNVMLIWSGLRAKAVAEALRVWLPSVMDNILPWMSEHDLETGTLWPEGLAIQLEHSGFGIPCLTPENLTSRYVLFESGAASKFHRARLVPYLHELQHTQVPPPLGHFNGVLANREGTRKLLDCLNSQRPGGELKKRLLDTLFDAEWPVLQSELEKIPPAPPAEDPKVDVMVREILGIVRNMQGRTVTERHISGTARVIRPESPPSQE